MDMGIEIQLRKQSVPLCIFPQCCDQTEFFAVLRVRCSETRGVMGR